MPNTDKGQSPTGAGQLAARNAAGEAPSSKMPGFGAVQQQIDGLRQTLHGLMAEAGYADGEIISAAATLDTQLEDFSRRLTDKKQPSLRTF